MSIPDLTGLTTAELEAVRDQVNALLAVAWAVETAQDRAAAVQEEAREALDQIARGWRQGRDGIGSEGDPVAWVAPTGAHDVWPRGSWVVLDGVAWHNPDHPANAWRPGDVGSPWVRQDDPDPDSGHIAWAVGQDVKTGDERTHDGQLWRAKLDHQTHSGWAPSPAAHAVWTDLGPLEDA